MNRIKVGVLVGCAIISNVWVCTAVAHEGGAGQALQVCEETVARLAGQLADCGGSGERTVTVTTTTLPPSSVDGGFPTPCVPATATVTCQWTSANGKFSKHCTIADGTLTARCGGIRTNRAGQRIGKGCVVRGF